MPFQIGSFHTAQAKSHIAIAKCHAELGKYHAMIADAATHKSVQGIRDDCHESISECHKELSQHHADVADQHIKAAKGLRSEEPIDTHSDERGTDVLRAAAGPEPFGMLAMRDFSKVQPTAVHLALPDVPPSVRLVGRPGGPPVNVEPDDTDAIDRLGRAPDEVRKAILGQ